MLKDGRLDFEKVYIAIGYTDLRSGINGLAQLVENEYNMSVFDRKVLFLFCGRKANVIKGLIWEEDGFILITKRYEKGHVNWPRNEKELREISNQQYHDLLSGLLIEATVKKVEPKRYS